MSQTMALYLFQFIKLILIEMYRHLSTSEQKLNIFFSPYEWSASKIYIHAHLFVDNIKVLGLINNNKQKWNNHVNNTQKNAGQRLYALSMLKNIMTAKELSIRSLIDNS